MEHIKIPRLQVLIIFSVVTLLRATTAEPPVRNYLPPNAGNNGYQGNLPSANNPDRNYLPPSAQQNGYPGSGPSGFSGGPGGYPSASGGGYQGGNNGDDGLSEPANYEFSYQVKDEPSGNDFGHQESRQGDVARGRYYVLLPDGRTQIVEYTADQDGYKPQIRYEGEVNAAASGSNGGYPSGPQGGYPSGQQNGYPSGQQNGYPSGNGNNGYRY